MLSAKLPTRNLVFKKWAIKTPKLYLKECQQQGRAILSLKIYITVKR